MKPKQEDPKEMVGGCCVCSDENGWTENPLVYCDGLGCTVAVHQACYGIVTVPTGAWFCRKCESQERAHSGLRAHTYLQKCELCPSKDGALKPTDSGGWAHVVCALYIPEVRFGNVTTMEPIMLQLIPPERFNKSCYICEESGKESRATVGACMQCNKSGCKQHFHVTCAQAMGLLCEEAGNYLDNVKYCGYCQYHFSKLHPSFQKKGSHVKTIPPYRPVPFDAGTSDEEKGVGQDLKDPKMKKRNSRPHASTKLSGKPGAGAAELTHTGGSGGSGGSSSSSGLSSGSGTNLGAGGGPVVTLERHVDRSSVSVSGPSSSGLHSAVPSKTETLTRGIETGSISLSSAVTPSGTSLKSGVTITPASHSSSFSSSITSTPPLAPISSTASLSSANSSTRTSTVVSTVVASTVPSTSPLSSSITCVPSTATTTTATTLAASSTAVPSARSRPMDNLTSVPVSSQSKEEIRDFPPSTQTHDQDKDKLGQDRNRKSRKNGPRTPSSNSNFGDTESNVSNEDAQSGELVLNVCEEKNLGAKKDTNSKVPSKAVDSSDEGLSLNVQFTPNVSAQAAKVDPFTPTSADFAISGPIKRMRSGSQERGRRNKRGGKRVRGIGVREGSLSRGEVTGGRDSGASSPDSFTTEFTGNANKRGKKKSEKDSNSAIITNGVGANALLLGNQLNPASAVAQKMTDTLHAELEAHAIYKDEDEKKSNSLIGPMLPGKKENANNNSNGSQPPPFPQSLEQLLERQWEQGSQFLMEQAQHFDIASLLSCLHQLRQENVRLEETVDSLIARRDHLLAVNARLSVPLSTPQPTTSSQPASSTASSSSSRPPSTPGGMVVTQTPHHPHQAPVPHSVERTTTQPPPTQPAAPPPQGPPPPQHSQSHHTPGGPAPVGPGAAAHRGASPHDRRGTSPHDRRGTSPHDRRGGPHPPPTMPVENGLGEAEYRYRSPGAPEHRQQSPMLPPAAQPSPTPLRHSPATGSYHPSASPHGVPALSPSGVSHGPSPHNQGPHGPSPHAPPPTSHGPPPPPPHSLGGHAPHGPPMVSSAAHTPSISRASEHRGDLVRLHGGPHGPMPPSGFPVYQMVSPSVPVSHHSTITQGHPQHPHSQVIRRDLVEPGRGGPGPLEKR